MAFGSNIITVKKAWAIPIKCFSLIKMCLYASCPSEWPQCLTLPCKGNYISSQCLGIKLGTLFISLNVNILSANYCEDQT